MAMQLGNGTVQAGATGEDVRKLQLLLTGIGYTVAADGIFGPQTKNAVIAFQRSKGLIPDGVVGPQTWAALQAIHAPPPPPPAPPAPPAPTWQLAGIIPWIVGAGLLIVAVGMRR